MMGILPINNYSASGDKKNSHAICLKTLKHIYLLIAKNKQDRKWCLSIKDSRQKLRSMFFEMIWSNHTFYSFKHCVNYIFKSKNSEE